MKLGTARIAYPFVAYSVDVTHHTERKSTAMEWMLLEIAQKAEDHLDYKNVPLEIVLTSIFSVADGNMLLRQVLTDLVDANALEQIPGFSDRSEWNKLRCGDLRLTDDGRRLQREGKLPAKENTNEIKIFYDVTNNRLVNDGKGMSDNTTNPKAREVDDNNMPGFPNSLINQRIEEWQTTEKNAPSWLQKNSRIDNIAPKQATVKWRNVGLDITVDNDGNLGLTNEEDAQIAEKILQVTDLGAMPDYELPVISVSSLVEKKKFSPFAKIGEVIDGYAAKTDIFVLTPQFSNILDEKSNKICLLAGQPTFMMDDTGKNMVIHIPDVINEGMFYQDRSRSVYGAAIEGHIGNISRQIPYVYENGSDFSTFVATLVKKYYMTDRRMLKLLEYVDGVSYQEFYTPDYVRELLNSSEIQILTPIDKILDRLLKLDDKVQKVLGDVPSPVGSETIRLALLNQDTEVLGDVYEWTVQWRETIDTLKRKTTVDLNAFEWQNTTFGLALERMEQVAEAVSLFYDDAAARYNKVYIFDTCALMHYPDVLDDFANNQAMAIVPKQVLVELDGLKESDDADEERKARRAINKIREYGDEPWLNQNEDNYLELLSESYRVADKKDFFILSVALKYRVKKPVMVTDDTNFQNFAISERVETITAHGLHEKLNATISKGKGKKNKDKKRKNRKIGRR